MATIQTVTHRTTLSAMQYYTTLIVLCNTTPFVERHAVGVCGLMFGLAVFMLRATQSLKYVPPINTTYKLKMGNV